MWDKWRRTLEPLRVRLNAALGKSWEELEIPREASATWSAEGATAHSEGWQARIAELEEIDASIAAKAGFEYLYDKLCIDSLHIRVAGPFTVENLSPHHYVPGDLDDSLVHEVAEPDEGWEDYGQMVLESLKVAGSSTDLYP
jgi:adenine-specific DNA-methyltransferase